MSSEWKPLRGKVVAGEDGVDELAVGDVAFDEEVSWFVVRSS